MQFKFIKHKNLSDFELNRIIELKDQIWVHGFEKQVAWMKQNVSENDFHVLLENENNLIAYAQLIQIDFLINNKQLKGLGISNVCAIEKGKGVGKSLMNAVNTKLEKSKMQGLLFCQLKNVEFYKKCGWQNLNPDHLKINCIKIDNQNVFAFIFNYSSIINSFEYYGKVF